MYANDVHRKSSQMVFPMYANDGFRRAFKWLPNADAQWSHFGYLISAYAMTIFQGIAALKGIT